MNGTAIIAVISIAIGSSNIGIPMIALKMPKPRAIKSNITPLNTFFGGLFCFIYMHPLLGGQGRLFVLGLGFCVFELVHFNMLLLLKTTSLNAPDNQSLRCTYSSHGNLIYIC